MVKVAKAATTKPIPPAIFPSAAKDSAPAASISVLEIKPDLPFAVQAPLPVLCRSDKLGFFFKYALVFQLSFKLLKNPCFVSIFSITVYFFLSLVWFLVSLAASFSAFA
nr:MAG TPA: hypothetical protein [Caudoviricetes sp.]